jgi:hypothetical protein
MSLILPVQKLPTCFAGLSNLRIYLLTNISFNSFHILSAGDTKKNDLFCDIWTLYALYLINMDKSYGPILTDNQWPMLLHSSLSRIPGNVLVIEGTSFILLITSRISFHSCVLCMSGKCNVIADGPKDKKQRKNCFYITECRRVE